MAVRALVFDGFGTLVDRRSGIADVFRASAVPGDPDELADAWRVLDPGPRGHQAPGEEAAPPDGQLGDPARPALTL